MKIKKYLMLSFVFVFMLLGVVNVDATEYNYGYYYRKFALTEGSRFWNPRNEAEIKKEAQQGKAVWDEKSVIFDVDSEGNVSFPFKESLTKLDDGIYELWIDDTASTFANALRVENGSIYLGMNMSGSHNLNNNLYLRLVGDDSLAGAFFNLLWTNGVIFNLSLPYDMFVNIKQMYDFTYIEDYYETHGKMPEVVVACEYSTNSFNNKFRTLLGDIDFKNGFANMEIVDFHQLASDIFDMIWLGKDPLRSERITVFYVDDLMAIEGMSPGYDGRHISPGAVVLGGIPGMIASGVEFKISNCYYFAQNKNSSLNVCYSFDDYLTTLENYSNKFGCDSDEYNDKLNELDDYCQKYLASNGTAIIDENGNVIERACSEKCKNLDYHTGKICGGYQDDYRCGAIGTKLAGWILRMLKIIRYIVPVLVIILSVLDFIGAVGSNNDDAMKKASQKFTKRIIAAVVLFLLPVILQFLFDIFKIPGLESSNPFCMK